MIPYGRQSIDDDDVDAVVAALRSDWLTTGPLVDSFDSAIAELVGHGTRATSVTSGTAALHVAYAAAEVSGGQVVTTPMTFVATAATAALLGAEIVFADIDPDNGNISPDAVAAAVTSRTRAVTGVDYAGVPVDVPALSGIAHDAGALFIEDAAHSIGSLRAGVPVGAEADLTAFSFFPTKNLTSAEGGAVVTSDPELDRRVRSFRNHGLVRDPAHQRFADVGPWHQEVHAFGLNYRLPDVLCALGLSQLQRIQSFKLRRAEIHRRYSEALAHLDGVDVPRAPEGTDPMWHLYPLRVQAYERRRIFEDLRAAGIGVQVNYIPAYWHPVFEDLGYRRGLCPAAEEFYSREISLPMYVDLSDADVDRVIEAVTDAVTR